MIKIPIQADVDEAGKKIEEFAKKSRTALNSLSLVAQDLPFGFIGIQNNLPGVISSFGELTREAGGVGGALKQLGGALIGPAGLFLAFSVVTSAITALTLKYGSLGAAFDSIFGKTTKLTLKIKELSDSYVQFNKNLKTSEDISSQEGASLTGTIAKIETLTKVILDQTKSYNERNAALNTLKELDKERFGNLDLETLKVKALTDAVDNYTNSLIAAAVTKGFEQEIGRTSVEISKQVSILKELDEAKKTAAAAPQRIVGKAELIDRTEIQKTESAYNKQLAVVRELTKRKNELSEEIRKSVESQIALKAPVDAATAALEKQKKAEKELAAAKKKIKAPKELDIEELSRKARYAALKLEEQADKNRLKYLQEQLKLEQQITKETFAQADKDMKADAEAFSKVNFKKLSEFTKPLDELQKSFEATKIFLQDIFFNPLQDLFKNFLDTGKFTFKEFGNVVLENLKRIVAQIAAQQVIQLLAQVLNPLGALASTGVLTNPAGNAGKGQKSILSALSNIFLGRVANPNFGGIESGQMGMSGSVNLVLRGTDLVGSINRTNSQISRVG